MLELIVKWRDRAKAQDKIAHNDMFPLSTRLAGAAVALNVNKCADELEAYLNAIR